MKFILLMVGSSKASFSFVKEGVSMYEKRIKHYCTFEQIEIGDLKNSSALSPEQVKEKESELILKHIKPQDQVILLDEKGDKYTSIEWAKYIEAKMVHERNNIVFVIGGAYGFSKRIYQRANEKLSVSEMTFSHQIIRLFFVEQLYRAMTIIKGEPYHNE